LALERRHLAQELHELIAALDRRVPRLERADERSIARDAAMLRAKAAERLAELQGRDDPSEGTSGTTPLKARAGADDCS
jgi:hypothetical protein